ncbi:MAG TPA: PspA/IM30 family protein [Anaerolineae bacterium]|nr:PspA/IM30 family protein [Caldilineae bacterium]HID35075.1 PspA/IM30 family protein [Anaerolineae bacterium]HIQ12364.1 PspA/IM30 family protein [Caldilineales bacterium]
MSIIARFKAIFAARTNAAADSLEDPKASLDYSLSKLEEARRELSRSLIEVSAAKRRLQNQRMQMVAAAEKYQQQAEAAVDADRDDLARLALERKQESEARVADLDANIASLERQEASLKENQIKLDRKIKTFRYKKEELKAIHDSAKAQVKVQESLSGISKDLADVGNTIRRTEERILEMESRADAIDALVDEGILQDVLEPETDDIERELARIGRNQAVEDELARLKASKQSQALSQAA